MADEQVGVIEQERLRQAVQTDEEAEAEHYQSACVMAHARGEPWPDREAHRAQWKEARR